MSVAEKLISQGRIEGRIEGQVRGQWIGKIQVLEDLMGLPATDKTSFPGMTAAELETAFRSLQQRYDAQFGRRD